MTILNSLNELSPKNYRKKSSVSDLPCEEDASEFYARYEPREVLGRGLVSVVRKCIERNTGEVYAVKIIDIGSEEGKKIVNETRKEIEILKVLKGDDNVIKLHESLETAAFIFLVLEFCMHGELFDHMTQVVTVSTKKTRQIMYKLLSVVQHMHTKFIVHRDIKPENILLDENYNIKVSDFGFATYVTDDYDLTELMGTPGYMSPEVLKLNMKFGNVQGYGRPTDVWACGVLMFTLMSGQPPFWHRKQTLMLRQIMEAKYSFDTAEWTDVSSTAKDLISRMLTADPEERITAEDALNHDFFVSLNRGGLGEEQPSRKFNARLKLKAVFIVVLTITRLKIQVNNAPLTAEFLCASPYESRAVRKMIDSLAFKIYGHWVKKSDDHQNRAALFANNIRRAVPIPSSPSSSSFSFSTYGW